MELLEDVARQLQYFLSDFHYKRKVMDARDVLSHLVDRYPLEEWVNAYKYIFYDEASPNGRSAKEVYEEIYQRLTKEGTPLDPEN